MLKSQTFKVSSKPRTGGKPATKVTRSSDLFDDDFGQSPKKPKTRQALRPAVVDTSTSVVPFEPKPAALPAKRSGKLGKTDMSNLKTLFGDRAEDILEMIESNNRDGALTLLYRQLLSMTVDIIPFAENLVRSTKGYRGVYQINALVSQCRELLADIQSTQDRGAMGRNLVEKHVRPAFLDIAMQVVTANQQLGSNILLLLPPDKHDRVHKLVQDHQRSVAEYIQAQFVAVRDELMRGLS